VQWRPVDVVAAILAVGLSSAVILILVVTGIQITQSSLPTVELSSNASQILTGAVGGLAGLLGGYLGHNLADRRDTDGSGK
jgi:hypothetical protein